MIDFTQHNDSWFCNLIYTLEQSLNILNTNKFKKNLNIDSPIAFNAASNCLCNCIGNSNLKQLKRAQGFSFQKASGVSVASKGLRVVSGRFMALIAGGFKEEIQVS